MRALSAQALACVFWTSSALAQEAPGLEQAPAIGQVTALPKALASLGISPASENAPLTNLSLLAALGVALVAIIAALLAARAARKARKLALSRERDSADIESRLYTAESILAAEPDAVFIWSPESMRAPPGTFQSRPRIVGSTATLVDPASGDLDFDYLLSRLEIENAGRLNTAVQRLRARGARFSLHVHSVDGRTFEAEGRPAGALAVLWLRDVTGERAEISHLKERLRQAEQHRERFEEHVMSAPFPAWRRDRGGKLVWINKAYAKAVDAASTDDAIMRGLELLDGETLAKLRRHLFDREWANETAHAIMSGERRTLDIHEHRVADGQTGIAIDVTSLERVEQELRRHIESHAATLDRVATAVAICGPDKRLKFRNRAFETLWGLDPAWLDTEPSDSEILDQLRAQRRLPEQVNYQVWKQERMELYTSNKPIEEYWHLPDGRIIKLIGQAHPFGGVIYLYENVTEQLNLESSFKTLTRVQRETIDNLYEGVAVFGSDGRLKLWNPSYARIWALDATQLSGEPHINEITELSASFYENEKQRDAFRKWIADAQSARMASTSRMQRTDDSVIDYAMVPLPDGASLLTFVDVTDSIKMELALRERNDALETADRLKSEFISHVSYQLRTPLTNIVGFGEILEAEMFGGLTEKQHEYTRGILQSSQTLLNIVNDILDLAVIEAGAMTLDLSDVSASGVVHAAEEFARRASQANKVTLKVECPEGLGAVRADEKRVKQMMINLLSNALAFTSPGDTITIGAKSSGNTMQFYVADTGDGIKPDLQATVFDRFEAHSSPGRRRGAGLGLSLVRSFAELHGGWVTLESAPDLGTCVTCHLPLRGVREQEGETAAQDPTFH